MYDMLPHIYWLPVALALGAALYAVVAVIASVVPVTVPSISECCGALMSVSVLKPLCGAEPRLFDNLATFCEQTHPDYELICGVSRADDPAIATVLRLQSAYPRCQISLVIDPRVHGTNLKVSNLINLAQWAQRDVFVIADSDIAVGADYLERVCAPLEDLQVGVVTCLYRAKGVAGFWSRVGMQFVNEWFVPSVRVAHMFGSTSFGFGATLALRRATLERIGGFERLRNTLADDYWLAGHVRELGLHTVLSPVVVETDVTEITLAALWDRETRWLRTIRSLNRVGFTFLFVTITLPWMLCGAGLAFAMLGGLVLPHGTLAHPAAPIAIIATTTTGLLARLTLHAMMSRERNMFWCSLALTPVRDALMLVQWMVGLFGSTVKWRGVRMPVTEADIAENLFRREPVNAFEVSDVR
jgi:ceramide glucosyltransferase